VPLARPAYLASCVCSPLLFDLYPLAAPVIELLFTSRQAAATLMVRSGHVGASLLGPGRSNLGPHTFLFLGRRQYRWHAERFNPEFAAPASRVIQVLVLLLFDLFERSLQHLRLFTLERLSLNAP
jgi:hypothetical protein